MPTNGKSVLILDASEAVTDYSYLLNTTSFEWIPVNILNAGAGPRFGHSGNLLLPNTKKAYAWN
jgi:hypothetical protein